MEYNFSLSRYQHIFRIIEDVGLERDVKNGMNTFPWFSMLCWLVLGACFGGNEENKLIFFGNFLISFFLIMYLYLLIATFLDFHNWASGCILVLSE